MMRRLLEWLFPFLRVQALLIRARNHGRVTLQETDLPEGLGWTCSIRPPALPEGIRHKPGRMHQARYAWTGTGPLLEEAIRSAVEEADQFPVMMKLEGIPYAPKLGGKEFDDA